MKSDQALRASGLDSVVVADTNLSEVDGQQGHLLIAGYDIERIAYTICFEDVCGLLWEGALPDTATRTRLARAIGRGRLHAFERIDLLGDALKAEHGMDALRTAISHLGLADTTMVDADSSIEQFARLTGAMTTFAAAWARVRGRLDPIKPDPLLFTAADYLRMVHGEPKSEALARALDTYLVTVSDHGMNASTFAARVVTSTGSDAVSAVTAAIGALKGPLHGGAPGPVLDMLDAIGTAERAEQWIEQELIAGRRIMGMGHRIYRVRDPRAAVFERAIETLEHDEKTSLSTPVQLRLTLSRAVEQAAHKALLARHPDRPLCANVEFYTAVLLEALGLPRTLFSPTFAVGRVAGWCAHIQEQHQTGRLMRPSSRYIGPRHDGVAPPTTVS